MAAMSIIWLTWPTVTVAVELTKPAEAKSPVPGTDDPNFNRPLTPLSRCLQVSLPAEISRTAAGAFRKTALQNCGDSLGASTLIHAKVYTFAHRFLLFDPEELALEHLTQVLLVSDTQTRSLFPHLIDTIHHVYNSTPSAKLQDNPARKLLSQYVALRYTTFSDGNLDMIISKGGEFMIDLSHKLARRLAMSGSSTQSLEKQIDELQVNVNRLEIKYQNKENQLERAKQEVVEWESWNRGISGKYRKAKRKVVQSDLTVGEPLRNRGLLLYLRMNGK